MSPEATVPNPQVPLAVLLCFAAYTDNPDQKDPNNLGVYNIQTAVWNFQTSYYPKCEVVWSSNQTADDNYAYIARTPDNQFFLAVRGSLPFEVNGSIVLNWGVIANWLLEDFDVYSQAPWPYAAGAAYVASGTMTAFSNLLTAEDIMGSGLTAYDYLKQNAVAQGHPVYITGHSLGGNIANTYASYFAYQLKADGLSNSNNYLYTFAAPAAGNKDFAADLDSKFPTNRSFHYEIDNDIIPKFPVQSRINGVSDMFSPNPEAAHIYLADTFINLQELLEGVAITIAASVTSPYAPQSTITTMPYPLTDEYLSNTFSDWFNQASYQHTCIHYLFMFIINADDIVAKLAPRMTKAKSMHLQPVAA
ncbi:lipase family protein [Hymenobacter negativus]|uniref:Lipase family protein n=1 Tax=Hymenobacter negativus TaxID=2795026 RepID=A0ABS3Q9I9_9BACT|nr:lipase family protein [Hymenobacter negativus]MBO2007917.1 lipase family protein [Hymenobacter negativus]